MDLPADDDDDDDDGDDDGEEAFLLDLDISMLIRCKYFE